MFLDIGPGEFLVIAIVAILLVGPDKLPRLVTEAVKWLRVLRDQAARARNEIVAAADIDPAVTAELRRSVNDLAELHPKRLAASLLSDVPETAPAPPVVPPPVNSFGASATSTSLGPRPEDAPAAPPTAPAAFDPEAT